MLTLKRVTYAAANNSYMYLLMLQQSENIIECLSAFPEMKAAVPLKYNAVSHNIFKFAVHDFFYRPFLASQQRSQSLSICQTAVPMLMVALPKIFIHFLLILGDFDSLNINNIRE